MNKKRREKERDEYQKVFKGGWVHGLTREGSEVSGASTGFVPSIAGRPNRKDIQVKLLSVMHEREIDV